MPLVAGVDSSTQSCKVLIVDVDTGAPVRSGRAPHPAGTEVNPESWWQALQAAIADAGGLVDVAGVSVGGQQHGLVALDSAGVPVRDALLWNDTRSAPQAAAIAASVGAAEYARRAGSVPVASFTASKLAWVAQHEPELAARIAAVALPHDWLTWRLRGFGPARPELDQLRTDRSEASGTGYFSPATGSYDTDLLRRALGRVVLTPEVLGPWESAGVVAGTSIVLGAGAGDNAAAALGLGLGAGDVAVSIGTSGTVFASHPDPIADPTGTVAGFADAAGGFLPLVATLNAAQVLDVTARLLGVDHAELDALALAGESGAGGMVFVPYLAGERTPNLPDATGSLRGLTLSNLGRENLARAAVEGMLCGLADGLSALQSQGVTASRVLLIGGGGQGLAVRSAAAAIFGLPVEVPEPGEYVARGAARQAAAVVLGTLPDWQLPLTARATGAPDPALRANYALWAAEEAESTRRGQR